MEGFTITGGNATHEDFPDRDGGGLFVDDGGPTIRNCVFTRNAATYGGGVFHRSGPVRLVRCRFYENSAAYGGAMYIATSDVQSINCVFTGNSSRYSGAAVYNSQGSSRFTNCLFNRNISDWAAVLANNIGNANFFNCTISDNSVRWQSSMIRIEDADSLTLENCILWGNTSPDGTQVEIGAGGSVTIGHCDLQGGQNSLKLDPTATLNWHNGNVDIDPVFADPDGRDNVAGTPDDDFRLVPGSPCIDAADNTGVPADTVDLDGDAITTEPTPLDLDESLRFVDDPAIPDTGIGTAPLVDMGAHEYNPDNDYDNDGVANMTDNCPFTDNPGQTDIDVDGAGDTCDLCPNTLTGVQVDPDGCPVPIPGDHDHDGDVDHEDFGHLQACLTGGSVPVKDPACHDAKLDGDADVDPDDVALFLRCMSGPNRPADPHCAD